MKISFNSLIPFKQFVRFVKKMKYMIQCCVNLQVEIKTGLYPLRVILVAIVD